MNTELRKDCPMRHECGNCQPAGGFCTAVNDPICEALHNAYNEGWHAAALWARQEVAKNEPLTLDELRQMDGEPVWVEPLKAAYGSGKAWSRYGFINGEKVDVPGVDYWRWWLKNYGKTWIAYRRKPKEAAADGTPKN